MRKYVTIFAVLAVAIVAALGFAYLHDRQSDPQATQAVNSLIKAAASGDRKATIVSAQDLLRNVPPTDPSYGWGLDAYAQSLYHNATTSAERVQAIGALRQWFALPNASSYERATAVALMAHLLMFRPDGAAYADVFADAHLSSLKDDDSVNSITNLINYSLQLRPNYTAYLADAYQNANSIFGILRGSATSSQAQLEQYAAAAARDVRLVEGASDAPSAQQPSFAKGPYAISAPAWQKYMEAYALDAASRIDKSNYASAKADYDAAIAEAVRDTTGSNIIRQYAATSRLAKARLMLAAGPSTDHPEIVSDLADLVAQITQEPNTYAGIYGTIKAARDAKTPGSISYALRKNLVALAAISPELKSFLVASGWTL